jgi:hypothetical protein
MRPIQYSLNVCGFLVRERAAFLPATVGRGFGGSLRRRLACRARAPLSGRDREPGPFRYSLNDFSCLRYEVPKVSYDACMPGENLAVEPGDPEVDGGGHPDPADLERFMRLELSREKGRAVVRHLLAGCPQCRHITRELWRQGSKKSLAAETLLLRRMRRLWQRTSPKPTRRKKAMAALLKAAQEMLLEISKELQGIHTRLETMVAALPPSEESDWEPDDVATELRNVIRTVNERCLVSAIDDLRLAAYFPEEPPEEESSAP